MLDFKNTSPLSSLILLNMLNIHKEQLIRNASPLLSLIKPLKLDFSSAESQKPEDKQEVEEVVKESMDSDSQNG